MIAHIDSVADKYRVPRGLIHAIIHQESKYQPSAINDRAPIKSYGLGQLTIATAIHRCGLKPDKIMDMHSNLDCTAKVLSYQLRRYGGDEFMAISAYNAGTYTRKNYSYTVPVFIKYVNCHK